MAAKQHFLPSWLAHGPSSLFNHCFVLFLFFLCGLRSFLFELDTMSASPGTPAVDGGGRPVLVNRTPTGALTAVGAVPPGDLTLGWRPSHSGDQAPAGRAGGLSLQATSGVTRLLFALRASAAGQR